MSQKFNAAAVKRFVYFVSERFAIWDRRLCGAPKPWTQDPILQQYRFCNVYREHDKVTQWIAEHIRAPFEDHPHLWFMLCIARQINWPDTLSELIADKRGAWPYKTWNAERARQIMLARRARGDKLYTGAYMLNAQFGKDDYDKARDKAFFTTHLTLQPHWEQRTRRARELSGTLHDAAQALQTVRGWGSFMSAQVVADLKFTRYLANAPDWEDWALLGPGSERGLGRIFGMLPEKRHVKKLPPEQAIAVLQDLRAAVWPVLERRLPRRLCLQNLQNCLCEFDKYERVRLGEGRPRALYAGLPDA